MAETKVQANNKALAYRGQREHEMSKLTTSRRDKLPAKDFAGPDGSYPVEDRGHAIAAKGRAKQMLKRGVLSKAAYEKIVGKANRKLGEGHHS